MWMERQLLAQLVPLVCQEPSRSYIHVCILSASKNKRSIGRQVQVFLLSSRNLKGTDLFYGLKSILVHQNLQRDPWRRLYPNSCERSVRNHQFIGAGTRCFAVKFQRTSPGTRQAGSYARVNWARRLCTKCRKTPPTVLLGAPRPWLNTVHP